MKRILSMIVTLALVIACLPVFPLEVHAVTIASGECGDNATWTLDDAGTLTISGTGGLMIFDNYNDPWKEYRSSIKKVVMHEGITAINHKAFAGCKNLISVELPKSLWGIGPYAFSGCSSLPEIEIPDAVHLIRENAFSNCTSLTSVVIPDSVTSLEGSAFAYCTSLTDVIIGKSVTAISSRAFEGCVSLTSVEIPDSVTIIESNAFRDCTSLTDVTIGNSVTTIDTYAFINCTSLTNVTIGSSVTTIGGGAFRCCSSLNNVVIPDSVTDLGGGAFYKCSSLSNVVMPDSVTYMGHGVFEGCTSLTELPLSSSIDRIIQGMFDGCTGLTNVVIPDFITKIGAGAFRDCTGLTSITISNSVTEIIDGAFSGCTALAEVTIPASVIEIENHAFYNCTGLKKITFEGDAPRIYSDIFHNVTATAYYPANAVTWTEEARQNYGGTITWVPYGEAVAVIASGTCGVSANWILDETGRLTIFGTSNTYGYKSSSEMPWYPYFSSIKSVDIKDGITTLGSYSFAGCTSLTSVTCSDTLRNIESAAFAGCTNLTSVTFGDSLESLYGLTFQGCTSLTEITIPDRVTSIGGSTFADCTNLKSVTLGNSLTGISSFLFANCTSLTSVTIPGTVTAINQSAFAGCTGLTSISIPNSVELIRDDAFTGCTNLSEIIFAGCAPEFIVKEGDGIFYNVTATAYYPSVMPDWKKDMLQNYGGNITWVPYESEDILIGSGSCGDDVTWKLDTTGTLTVSGTGDIYHYSATDRIPWYYDRLCIRTAVIEHGVTNICANAFDNCDNMTSVTIPDSVTRFGDSAFSDCDKLASVTIPDSVTQIPWYSFYGCNSLTTLVIPDSVTYIGPSAFQYCNGLTSLTIGNSLKEVAGFKNCSSLTNVTFGNSVEIISSSAFQSCTALKTITIPNTVKKIGYEAFMHCLKLTSVTIGSSVETIEAKAFHGCESLTEIIFLGDAPTFGWSQTENEGAFKGVTATAYYPADNDTWTEEVRNSTDGQIIWIPYDAGPKTIASGTCGANLTWTLTEDGTLTISGTGSMENGQTPAWADYVDSIKSVVIENGVTGICDNAFRGCGNLNQIIFKGSAPTIGDSAFGNVTAIAYYYPDETWTEAVLQNYGGTITWSAVEKGKLLLSGEEFANQDTVWIEGLPYPIQGEGNDRYVELPTENDCYMVTYTYHTGDANDVHTQYPTGMKVYKVSDGQITHIPQLDNLLQYSGASIRITGKKGIRMITSLTKTNKTALTGKGLAGFKLLEYGTALCFAHEIPQGDALVLGRDFTRSNYAYKKGVADPVFASTKDLIQYTNVLVGFSLDQCKDDIAMRPYIILEDAAGNQITLYGGTIYRSIGYIAYQNRTVFKPKTASYNYVWEIIHHVYGDKYDADYKG